MADNPWALTGTGGGSGGGSNPWNLSSPTAAGAPPKKKGGSLLGNALHGAEDVARSLPDTAGLLGSAALHTLTEGPSSKKAIAQKVAVPTLKGIQYDWAPLAHGDFNEWYRRFHANPTLVALDLATVATFGVGRAAALAALPKEASRAAFNRALIKGELTNPGQITARLAAPESVGLPAGAEIPIRQLPAKAFRAGRIKATDAALKKIVPPSTPGLGEFSRAARAAKRENVPLPLKRTMQPMVQAQARAMKKLNVPEQIAANAIPKWPLASYAEAAIRTPATLGFEDSALAQQLGNPAAWRAYESALAAHAKQVTEGVVPTGKDKMILDAAEATRTLIEGPGGREAIHLANAAISPGIVDVARYRNMRIAGGARSSKRLDKATENLRKTQTRVAKLQDELRSIDEGTGAQPAHLKRPRDLVESHLTVALVKRARQENRVAKARAKLGVSDTEASVAGLIGGPSIDQLRSEIKAANAPEPFYLPDVAVTEKGGFGGGGGSGLTKQRRQADVYQSTGTLQLSGKLLLRGNIALPAFLRAVKHESYLNQNAIAERIAVHIPKGDGLPDNMRWLRSTRGEKIPFIETISGKHDAELNDILQALPDHESPYLKGDTPAERDLAALSEDGKYRLAVPEAFARAMGAEFKQNNQVLRWIEQRPLSVWRALVLKIRVPWLIGNVLGNAVLTALRLSGANGRKAVLGMIATTRGGEAVRRALKMAETTKTLTDADIREHFAELSRGGTFIGANLPSLGTEAKLARFRRAEPVARKIHRISTSVLDFLPGIDRATEGALRRYGATKTALTHRVVNDRIKAGMEPREAILDAVQHEPGFRDFVVKEVNDALGDYLSMSNAERTHVRSLIPFYAWYREIFRIALRLPLDYPGRVALLAHLAVLTEEDRSHRPSYLAGFEQFPGQTGDRVGGVNLTPYNPLASAADVGSAFGTVGLAPSRRGAEALASALNPGIGASAAYIEALRKGDIAPKRGLIYQTLAGVVSALPEARVVTNPPSKQYPGRRRRDLEKQFFGWPVRYPSKSVMEQAASQGK